MILLLLPLMIFWCLQLSAKQQKAYEIKSSKMISELSRLTDSYRIELNRIKLRTILTYSFMSKRWFHWSNNNENTQEYSDSGFHFESLLNIYYFVEFRLRWAEMTKKKLYQNEMLLLFSIWFIWILNEGNAKIHVKWPAFPKTWPIQ